MSLVRSGEGRVISCGSDCFLVSLILRTKLSNIPSSAVQDSRKPPGVASETRRLSTSSSASRGEKTVEEGGNRALISSPHSLPPGGIQSMVVARFSETEYPEMPGNKTIPD